MKAEVEEVAKKARDIVEGMPGGGPTDAMLVTIYEFMTAHPTARTIETGSGVTTGLFCLLGENVKHRHVAIDPAVLTKEKGGLFKAVAIQKSLGERSDVVRVMPLRSVEAWSSLAYIDFRPQFVLIDGKDTGLDPIIDCCNAAMLLESGGLMLVDDVDQQTVGEGVRVVRSLGGMKKLRDVDGRGVLLRKEA